MEGQYQVAWTPTAKRALRRLPEKVATAAIAFIYGSLATNPQRLGMGLRFDLDGLHSAMRGDYRIICRIDDDVTIIAIEHRADVYRRRSQRDSSGETWPRYATRERPGATRE